LKNQTTIHAEKEKKRAINLITRNTKQE